jgi:hypothetical protein
MITHQAPKQTSQRLIYHLYLPIGLTAIGITNIKLGVRQLSQAPPKVAKELSISIKNYRWQQFTKLSNLSEIQLSYIHSVWSFLVSNKWVILENRSTTTKMESLPCCVLVNPNTKSMLTLLYGCSRIWSGMYKLALVVVPLHKPCDLLPHTWTIKLACR